MARFLTLLNLSIYYVCLNISTILKMIHGSQNCVLIPSLSPIFPMLILIALPQNFAIFILSYTGIKTISQNAYLQFSI